MVWTYTPIGAKKTYEDYTPVGQPVTPIYLVLRDRGKSK